MQAWFIFSLIVTAISARTWTSFNNNETYVGTLQDAPVTDSFCDSTTQHSGYYKIDGSKSKNYFYWFFESRNDPKNAPTCKTPNNIENVLY